MDMIKNIETPQSNRIVETGKVVFKAVFKKAKIEGGSSAKAAAAEDTVIMSVRTSLKRVYTFCGTEPEWFAAQVGFTMTLVSDEEGKHWERLMVDWEKSLPLGCEVTNTTVTF